MKWKDEASACKSLCIQYLCIGFVFCVFWIWKIFMCAGSLKSSLLVFWKYAGCSCYCGNFTTYNKMCWHVLNPEYGCCVFFTNTNTPCRCFLHVLGIRATVSLLSCFMNVVIWMWPNLLSRLLIWWFGWLDINFRKTKFLRKIEVTHPSMYS